MDATMTAIELTGKIDEHHQLHLDKPLHISGPMRVRVIVLYPIDNKLDETEWDETEWDETQWLQAATRNPAFEFLNHPEEDIYSLTDGEPFYDKV